jgi:predicted nucleic acid-binding protein
MAMSDRRAATLVDSNVLLDIFTDDPVWYDWSSTSLASALDRAPVVINEIVYAETAARFKGIEEYESWLDDLDIVRMPLSWSMAFLAGKCHGTYKARGGTAKSPLPDFFIGAHAAVAKLPLLTRDAKRYRTYFPTVDVIAPR